MKSWMACALRPALGWQRLQVHCWRCRLVVVVPSVMRSEAPSSSDAAGAGGRSGVAPQRRSPRYRGRSRGRGRRPRRTGEGIPSPEPSLGLASHVNLERLVSGLLQHCECGGVLVITDGRNPAVVGPEVRSGGKEGRDVGNTLPLEGPCRWHLWSGSHQLWLV